MSLYGCHAVELISPELLNGNSHSRSVNVLVWREEKAQSLVFLQDLVRNDLRVLSTSHFLNLNHLESPKILMKRLQPQDKQQGHCLVQE